MRYLLSSGLPVVVPQHAAEPFAADDFTVGSTDFVARIDQFIAEPLMVSFAVKMCEEFIDGLSQRVLAEEYHNLDTRQHL